MNSFQRIDKSQLLGFDDSGHPLWPVALSEDISESGEEIGVAKPSGEDKPAGLDKVPGTMKDGPGPVT